METILNIANGTLKEGDQAIVKLMHELFVLEKDKEDKSEIDFPE